MKSAIEVQSGVPQRADDNSAVSVSVIIPTFNRSELLGRAIDSVLKQTYCNYEIIVVDDGSTDSTRQMLAAYEDRIRYIYQENAGQSVARNTGIRAARGKWVAFLDSDDIWLPEKLARQVGILSSSNAKVCYTNLIWNSDGAAASMSQVVRENYRDKAEVFDEPFDLLLDGSKDRVLVTLVVDRELLCRVGCFDERLRYHEDVRLCLRLAFETAFAYIPEPLAVIDRRPELLRASVDYRDGLSASCGEAVSRAEAYLKGVNKRRGIVRELRHQVGHYVSKMAIYACAERKGCAARRLALDGLHFGGDWRDYRRCIAVLACPWLVRRHRTK